MTRRFAFVFVWIGSLGNAEASYERIIDGLRSQRDLPNKAKLAKAKSESLEGHGYSSKVVRYVSVPLATDLRLSVSR